MTPDHDELRRLAEAAIKAKAAAFGWVGRDTVFHYSDNVGAHDILALLDERDALERRVAELSKSRDEAIQWRNARL